jgi:type II secretory pathway component PulF
MANIELEINKMLFKADAAHRRRLWMKLSKLLSNGVPIIEAISTLYERRIAIRKRGDATTMALAEWMRSIKNGGKLSEAAQPWIFSDEQMLIAAGEQSGTLHVALNSVVEVMEAKKKIRSAVIGGLTYPAIMLVIAFGVLIMFSYKIIPAFAGIVPDEKWTGIARTMIDFANFSRDWMAVIVVAIIATIFIFFMSLPRWSAGARIVFDRYPPYSIYRIMIGGTWMISFAALVAAGVRLENALQYLARGASPWLELRINTCLIGMRSGLSVGESLARSGHEFPDPEIIDDLSVYSKLSGFDEAISILGREWISESVDRIQGMMKAVFSFSILVVGLFIAFMVGGLIGMELQMSQIMRSSYQ